jgi:hypothetical protein
MSLLGSLADAAVQAGGPGLSCPAFILGVLQELSVALCRGNTPLCRSELYVSTAASGRAPLCGQSWPWAEVSQCCCGGLRVPVLVRSLSLRLWASVASLWLWVGDSWLGFVRASICSAWAFPVQVTMLLA